MDEQLKRELQEALYGALAAIYRENNKTQDKGYDDQNIEIVVSGDSLSLIKAISEDTSLDDKIARVSDSFALLNYQLQKFNEMKVFGPEGSFTNFVNFISALSSIPNIQNLKNFTRDDAVNVSNFIKEISSVFKDIEDQNIQDKLPDISAILTFVSYISSKEWLDKIKEANKTLSDKNIDNIREFFKKIAYIFNDDDIKKVFFSSDPNKIVQGKGIEGIIALLNFVTQDGFFSKIMRARIALSMGGAKAIKDFLTTIGSIFNDEIMKNVEFDINNQQYRVQGLQAVLQLLDKVSHIGFVIRVMFAARYLTEERGKRLAGFFTGFINDLTGEISNTQLKQSAKIIDSMAKLFDSLTKLALGIGLIAIVITQTSPLMTLVVLFAVIKGVGLLLKEMTKATNMIDPKDLSKFSDFMNQTVLTIIEGVLGLAFASLIIKQVGIEDIMSTIAFLGLLVASVVGLSMLAKNLDSSSMESIKQISNMLLALSGAVFILSMSALLLRDVGWQDIIATLVLYVAVVSLAAGIVYLLSKFNDQVNLAIKSSEGLVDLFLNIAGIVALIGITAFASTLIEWEWLVKEAAIIGAAIGVMYLIGKVMEKYSNLKEDIETFAELVAILSISLLIVGLSAKIADSIPWKAMASLGIIIGAALLIMTLIRWIVGGENGEKVIDAMRVFTEAVLGLSLGVLMLAIASTIAATVTLGNVIALGLVVAGAIGIFFLIQMFSGKNRPISRENINNILLMQLCLLGIGLNVIMLGAIVMLIRKADMSLSDIGNLLLIIAGEVLIMGLIGLITMIPGVKDSIKNLVWLLAVMIGLELNILMLVGIAKIVNNAVNEAGGLWNLFDNLTYIIIGELGIMLILGLISKLVGKEAAIGMAILTACLAGIVGIVHYTAYVAKLARSINEDDILWIGAIIGQLMVVGAIIAGIGALGITTGPGLAMTIGLGVIELLLGGLLGVINLFISTLERWKKLTVEYGSLESVGSEIGNAFGGFLGGLASWTALGGMLIGLVMGFFTGPMLGLMLTLKMFVDIVEKIATMNFLSGYDENGKPIYERVDPAVFGHAANMISGGFKTFIVELGKGIRSLGGEPGILGWVGQAVTGGLVLETIQLLAGTMNPIMKAVGTFVDAIMKLLTGECLDGYDDNGKPKYKRIDIEDFGEAANKVSNSFKVFIEELGKGAKSLDGTSAYSIQALAKSMIPLMESVGKFVDAIMSYATGTYTVSKVVDGKIESVTQHVNDTDFTKGADAITANFIKFLEALVSGTENIDYQQRKAIQSLSKSLLPIMDSVASFVDAIMKLATGTITTGIEDLKITTRVLPEDFAKSARTVVTWFNVFLRVLNTSLKRMDEDTLETLETMSKTIDPLMKGISSFVDAILKLATGQYIDSYDENGKPHYATVTDTMYTTAATTLVNSFETFITGLRDGLTGISKEASDVIKMLTKGGLKDMMDALSVFTKIISSNVFLIDSYDEKGNPVYLRDESGQPIPIGQRFRDVAKEIALAISSFVLNVNLNLQKIKGQIPQTVELLKDVMKLTKPINEWTKSIQSFDVTADYQGATGILSAALVNFAGAFNDPSIVDFASDEKNIQLKKFKNNAQILLDAAKTIEKIGKLDMTQATIQGIAMVTMLKDLISIEVPSAALQYKEAINQYVQDYGNLADQVQRVTYLITQASLQGTMALSQQIYNVLFEGPGNFRNTISSFLVQLTSFDTGARNSIMMAKKFGDQFEESIEKIEKSLKKNENDRNKMLTDLTKHLDTIGTKLKTISQGLNEISKSSLDNVQKLAEEFARMQTEMIQSVIEAGGFNAPQQPVEQPVVAPQQGDSYTNVNNVNGNDTPNYFGGSSVTFTIKEAYPGMLKGQMTIGQ